ncbi:hypothetical protein ACVR05_04380 [Streptococcus caprae]|uniref:Uncharacterized protein n=1 Tax=Streptococcus caprae TaxID=1640501 RepID=A0ABV8CXZ6_9STRE
MTTVIDDWSDSTIAYLDYQDLLSYQFDLSGEPISLHEDFDLTSIKRSSFMTYAEQKLWVGYFDKEAAGYLSFYDLDENGLPLENITSDDLEDSKALKTVKIPEKIQGVAFYKDKIIFSQSYGDTDAHLLVYSNPGLENLTDFTNENRLETIDAPSYL